jgi:hypothetical protein
MLLGFLAAALPNVGSVRAASDRVVIYPAPPGVEAARDFRVAVDGEDVFVYDSKVAAFAYFSFAGKVRVSVNPDRQFERVDIRPLSRRIRPRLEGKAPSFDLDRPSNLSVELDGDVDRPLVPLLDDLRPQPRGGLERQLRRRQRPPGRQGRPHLRAGRPHRRALGVVGAPPTSLSPFVPTAPPRRASV